MKEPILVILAAGMGSRYGGLKQMDPVGPSGEAILDYSVFDAKRAGFKRVIFLIKHEIEEDFKRLVGSRIEKHMDVTYAYQQLDMLPEGVTIPEGRTKPWGTAHAALAARKVVDGPFAILNSDDYYGVDAFKTIYDYLSANPDSDGCYEYAMVGFMLKNTVTENGSVARGVCQISEDGYLTEVIERTSIETYEGGIRFLENGVYTDLAPETTVSMNMWGFMPSFLDELEGRFSAYLKDALKTNPLKCEFFLPLPITQLIQEGKATFKVLSSPDRWFGVTYAADKPTVVNALKAMTAEGKYPDGLWK